MTSEPEHDAPELDRGPSLLLPVLVTVAGVALAVHELMTLIGLDPAEGQPRPMTGLVLASALALGGFSLTRLLQLMAFAGARHRDAGAGRNVQEVPWQLTDAQAQHGVWVIGVGASIALMGLLGLWSLIDGSPSGLEPGWPLLLVGGGVALAARWAWLRTSEAWSGAGDGF